MDMQIVEQKLQRISYLVQIARMLEDLKLDKAKDVQVLLIGEALREADSYQQPGFVLDKPS